MLVTSKMSGGGSNNLNTLIEQPVIQYKIYVILVICFYITTCGNFGMGKNGEVGE